MSCVDLSYFYSSLDLLNVRGSRCRWLQMQRRIATNKAQFFILKRYFSVLRSLDACNRLNSICVLDQMTLFVTCYYWLQRPYFCLFLLERESERVSCDICFIFYRPQALSFRFYRFQSNALLNLYFFRWLLWVFKKERMCPSLKKDLTISRWIPFGSRIFENHDDDQISSKEKNHKIRKT